MARRPQSPPLTPPPLPTVHLARDLPRHLVASHLRAGTWRRVGRGAYVPADAPTTARSDAIARAVGVHHQRQIDHCFSHATAALVHGVPLWRIDPATHLYQRSRPNNRNQRELVRHQPMPDASEIVDVLGLPVTSLERTAWDCALTMRALSGLVVVDATLRAGVDVDALRARAAEPVGRRGVIQGRLLVECGDGGSESPYETACRYHLLRSGFPAPETQVPVETRLGTFWSDLGWSRWRVAVEYDGRTKYENGGSDALIREKRRHDAILEAGWRLVRVTRDDLRAAGLIANRVAPLLPRDVVATLRPRRDLVW